MRLTYHERRRAIAAARALFRDPNVLAIGIGEKEEGGEPTGEALVVTVARKPDLEAVPHGYRVPRVLRVPPSRTRPGFELQTDIVEGRRKRFAAAAENAAPSGSLRIRPEGHASEGTLGGLVSDQDGNVFVLSCSHVLSDYGRIGDVGVRIIELQGNLPIARLSRYLDLVPGAPNYADVAIARLESLELVELLLPRAPVVSVAPGTAAPGDPVEMVVQGPAPSVGRVSQTDVEEKVYGWGGDDGAYVLMSEQIEVEGLGARGDSGAIVTDPKRRAVGLFVADNGFKDLATPIKRALMFAGKPDITVHAEGDLGQLELAFLPPDADD